jgi:chromosomal replication initiator protein
MILKNISPKLNSNFKDNNDKNVIKIKEIVTSYFHIAESDLTSNSRKSSLVYARNLCFYIIRNKFNLSYEKIGEYFGDRDYTTIMHGYDKIKDVIDSDSKVKLDVQYIEEKLNN